MRLHDRLLEAGVSAILRCASPGEGPRLSFIVTAAHSLVDVERAAQAVIDIARNQGRKR